MDLSSRCHEAMAVNVEGSQPANTKSAPQSPLLSLQVIVKGVRCMQKDEASQRTVADAKGQCAGYSVCALSFDTVALTLPA